MKIETPKQCNVTNKIDNLQLWHERLCHQNKRHVQSFLKKQGIHVSVDSDFCDGCAYRKSYRLKFDERVIRATKPQEIIHSDLCGPMQVESLGKKKYSLMFKDEFSGYRYVYFLNEKSEVFDNLKIFCLKIENQFGENIKELHTNGGKEYKNANVKSFLKSKGIKFSVSVPYTPQQNGVSEREN